MISIGVSDLSNCSGSVDMQNIANNRIMMVQEWQESSYVRGAPQVIVLRPEPLVLRLLLGAQVQTFGNFKTLFRSF